MSREITLVTISSPEIPKLLKACAYARVSSEKDTMQHSLAAQILL